MTAMVEITHAQPLAPYVLLLSFSDGSVHEVDVGPALERLRAIVDVYGRPDLFAQVSVSGGTVAWPGGLDLDPLVLHGDFEPVDGEPYARRVVHGPCADQPA